MATATVFAIAVITPALALAHLTASSLEGDDGSLVVNGPRSGAGISQPGVCHAPPVHVTDCGSITVKNVTQNDPTGGTQTFEYATGSLGGATFILAEQGTKLFDELGLGAYSVTEGDEPTGWNFVSARCSDNATKASIGTLSGTTESMLLQRGQNVTCAYTNHYTNSPTIAASLSNANVVVGSKVHDTSGLDGASANAGGTVTYTVYSDPACTTGARDAGTVTVADAVVSNSNDLTFNTVGDFSWQAVYSGDADNNGATSTCTTQHLVVTDGPGAGLR
jgi:hypothetical protein